MKQHATIFLIILTLFCYSTAFAETGKADIRGTEEGASISGKVFFKDTTNGLQIRAEIENLPPGKHGFHIHQFGECSDMGKAAGGHFNPDGVAHGFLPKDGFLQAHAGDLGNIEANSDGLAKYEAVIPNLSLGSGKYSIGGRSLMIHEKEDDFGQPAGNAGGRIACGTITITAE